jgi:hypothetical protein
MSVFEEDLFLCGRKSIKEDEMQWIYLYREQKQI